MIKRIGSVIIIDSNLVVNAFKFAKHFPVGKLKFTLKRLQELHIDEVIILNSSHSDSPDSDFRKLYGNFDSWHISTPIAYGGGITSTNQAVNIIKGGADRIVISPKVLLSESDFSEIGNVLGEQSLILHLPLMVSGSKLRVLNFENSTLEYLISKIPENWGGEILISSVENDGSKEPDWTLIDRFIKEFGNSRSIILCSGFCTAEDALKGLELEEVHAIALGNFLHRTELPIPILKGIVSQKVQIR